MHEFMNQRALYYPGEEPSSGIRTPCFPANCSSLDSAPSTAFRSFSPKAFIALINLYAFFTRSSGDIVPAWIEKSEPSLKRIRLPNSSAVVVTLSRPSMLTFVFLLSRPNQILISWDCPHYNYRQILMIQSVYYLWTRYRMIFFVSTGPLTFM